MKKVLLFFCITISFISYAQDVQKVELMQYEELMAQYQQMDSVVYVINFWATWCKPCVEELPHFQKVGEEMKNENIQFLFVSLDAKRSLDGVLKKFLIKHPLPGRVILLDDHKRMNEWIPAIQPSWSGAIPATLIYKNNEEKFFIEGEIDEITLKELIVKNL